jgi:hypothetical protein
MKNKNVVTKSVSATASKVKAAKVPTDPKAVLTIHQAAKLAKCTAYQICIAKRDGLQLTIKSVQKFANSL